MDGLLKNKFVLYGVLFFAVTNVFGYLMTANYEAIVFFSLVGYLTSEFTKNNILIALIALMSTNLLLTVVQGRRIYESFKEGEGEKGKAAADAKSEDAKPGDAKSKEAAKPGDAKSKEDEIDKEITAEMNKAKLAASVDPNTMEDHMANLDRIENLLAKQEGLVGSLGKIENMMGRLENMGSMFKSKKNNLKVE